MQNLALDAAARCQSAREWCDWLQAGQLPAVVTRRRRTSWLKGGLLLALGMGIAFYAGTNISSPQEATQEPARQETSIDVSEEYYREICQKLGLYQLQQQLEASQQQYPVIEQDFLKKAGVLLEKIKGLAKENRSSSTAMEEFYSLKKRLNKLRENAVNEIDRNESKESAIYSQLQDISSNPSAHYPWKTQQEFLMLSKIQPRLEKDFQSGVAFGTSVRMNISQYGGDELWETEKALHKASLDYNSLE